MKRRAMAAAVAVLIATAIAPISGNAAITRPFTPGGGAQIAAGVHHEWGSLTVNDTGHRNVNVLEVDLGNALVDMRLSLAEGLASKTAPIVDQALAYSQDGRRVVATTNGSLFSYLRFDEIPVGGMGLGLNVSDGELINAGNPAGRIWPLGAFGITDQGVPIIGVPEYEVGLALPGGEVVEVDRINQVRSPGDVVLYTSRLGTHTWTDGLGDEYVIDGFEFPLGTTGTYTGTVVEVRDGAGDSTIGPGQAVVSVSDSAEPWATTLAVGSEVSLTVNVAAPWDSASLSVGGRDLLLMDGQAVSPEPGKDGNHARTAVGIDAQGKVILVSVEDGTLTNGLRLGDLTSLLQSLGAVHALNLDGGGSTQMAVRQPGDINVSLVTPTITPEIASRSVANALQVISVAPTGPLDRLLLSPAQAEAQPGEPIEFVVKGQDANLNGIALDPQTLEWTVGRAQAGGAPPGVELTSTGANITPADPGDYLVTVRSGDVSAESTLAVGDFVAPVIAGVRVAMADTGAVGRSSARIDVGWTTVENVGVATTEVQRRIGTGGWKNVSISSPAAIAASVEVAFGKRIQFRIRATDGSGNVGTWVESPAYRMVVFERNSPGFTLTGAWKKRGAAQAIGGQFLRSRAPGSNATLTFTGVQVAVIGNRGPTHGQADIHLGGSLDSSVHLGASALALRQVLYLSPAAANSTSSTAMIVTQGAASAPTVDIDAFLVLTPAT